MQRCLLSRINAGTHRRQWLHAPLLQFCSLLPLNFATYRSVFEFDTPEECPGPGDVWEHVKGLRVHRRYPRPLGVSQFRDGSSDIVASLVFSWNYTAVFQASFRFMAVTVELFVFVQVKAFYSSIVSEQRALIMDFELCHIKALVLYHHMFLTQWA